MRSTRCASTTAPLPRARSPTTWRRPSRRLPGWSRLDAFDTGSGNVAMGNSSGHGATGEIRGATWAPGRDGDALRFGAAAPPWSGFLLSPRAESRRKPMTPLRMGPGPIGADGWRIDRSAPDRRAPLDGEQQPREQRRLGRRPPCSVLVAVAVWFSVIIATGRAPRAPARRRTWWLPSLFAVVFAAGSPLSAPTGTLGRTGRSWLLRLAATASTAHRAGGVHGCWRSPDGRSHVRDRSPASPASPPRYPPTTTPWRRPGGARRSPDSWPDSPPCRPLVGGPIESIRTYSRADPERPIRSFPRSPRGAESRHVAAGGSPACRANPATLRRRKPPLDVKPGQRKVWMILEGVDLAAHGVSAIATDNWRGGIRPEGHKEAPRCGKGRRGCRPTVNASCQPHSRQG